MRGCVCPRLRSSRQQRSARCRRNTDNSHLSFHRREYETWLDEQINEEVGDHARCEHSITEDISNLPEVVRECRWQLSRHVRLECCREKVPKRHELPQMRSPMQGLRYQRKQLKLKRLAERVGFEPTLEFPLNTLSKRAPSATRPSLRYEHAVCLFYWMRIITFST